MRPDEEILIEQCNDAYKTYLMCANNAHQAGFEHSVITKTDFENGEQLFVSGKLVKVRAKG